MANGTELLIELMTAAIILCAWSYLYRGVNPFYRIVETLTVGVMLGFGFYQAIDVITKQVVTPLTSGNIFQPALGSLILGLLLYTRFNKDTAWIARWPSAIIAGVGLGIAVTALPKAQILTRLQVGSWIGPTPLDAFSNIIYSVSLLTSLGFFIFTREQVGWISVSARIGRFFMMIGFGTILGAFLMTNIAAPVDLMGTLITTTGGRYATAIAVVALIAMVIYERTQK
jgi:hypothetical protein